MLKSSKWGGLITIEINKRLFQTGLALFIPFVLYILIMNYSSKPSYILSVYGLKADVIINQISDPHHLIKGYSFDTPDSRVQLKGSSLFVLVRSGNARDIVYVSDSVEGINAFLEK